MNLGSADQFIGATPIAPKKLSTNYDINYFTMHSNCHVVTYFHKSESHGVWRILPVKKLPQTHYPIEGDRGGPFVHYKTLHTSNEYFLFMKEIDKRSSDKT